MPKVLVTGGAGFIGSNTVDLLLSKDYDVVVVDDLSTGKKKNINSKAFFYRQSICSKNLDKTFQKEKPDYVIHLAAQINVRESVKDPVNDANINIIGSINLLNSCVKHKVKKIIYSSSGGAVYGEPVKNPTAENHPISPLCPYGASKYCVEKYIELANRNYGLDYNILRYGNVYGPRQDPLGEAGVVAIFTKLLVEGKKPRIFGDGKQTRDFCYVGDIAQANLLGIRKKGKNKIYNVGTGKKTSVNQVTEKLLKYTGAKVKPINVEEVPGEVRHIYLNVKLIKKELGWSAKTNLDDGVKKTVEWLKNE